MMFQHFDSYGHRDIYQSPRQSQGATPFFDCTPRTREHRYLLWVSTHVDTSSGMRQTFRTRRSAIAMAHLMEFLGHGVRISDRKIRPGDRGFLARQTADQEAYEMLPSGRLITGTFEEIYGRKQ